MATVYFYEKPGCINNTRQKKLLAAADHQVVAKNLLAEAWQPERLRAFFGDMAVRDWFNYSAPAIKHGEIEPETKTASDSADAGKSLVNTSSLNAGRRFVDGRVRSAGGGQLDRLNRNRDNSGSGKLSPSTCTAKLRP